LQTGCSNKIYELGYVLGSLEEEKLLHIKFSKYKNRYNGEWFLPSCEILNYINENNLKPNTYIDLLDGKIFPLLNIKIINGGDKNC
jgi:hypothetical protein